MSTITTDNEMVRALEMYRMSTKAGRGAALTKVTTLIQKKVDEAKLRELEDLFEEWNNHLKEYGMEAEVPYFAIAYNRRGSLRDKVQQLDNKDSK